MEDIAGVPDKSDQIGTINNADVNLLTVHARNRLNARRLGMSAVRIVIRCGRIVHVRGAAIYAIGRREVDTFRQKGISLQRYEGVQVVCDPFTGEILTVYRNRNIRSLRPRRRTKRARKIPS